MHIARNICNFIRLQQTDSWKKTRIQLFDTLNVRNCVLSFCFFVSYYTVTFRRNICCKSNTVDFMLEKNIIDLFHPNIIKNIAIKLFLQSMYVVIKNPSYYYCKFFVPNVPTKPKHLRFFPKWNFFKKYWLSSLFQSLACRGSVLKGGVRKTNTNTNTLMYNFPHWRTQSFHL